MLFFITRPGERSEEIAEDQKEENLYAICDEGQIRSLLGKRLGICPKRQLYLVGIGMGNEKNRTVEAEQICQSADLLIGARRMLQSVKTEGKAVFESYKPDEIAAYLAEHPQYETAAVLSYLEISVFTAEQKNCTMRLNARKDWNRWKFTRSAAFLRWSISAENWAFPGRMSIF